MGKQIRITISLTEKEIDLLDKLEKRFGRSEFPSTSNIFRRALVAYAKFKLKDIA